VTLVTKYNSIKLKCCRQVREKSSPPIAEMLLKLLALVTLALQTTVTYRMAPHDRACFYTEAKKAGEKIGFYFAVSWFDKVQEGGNFDVDYEVLDPHLLLLFSGTAERQGDFVFNAKEPGLID
jgi:hypothetical protein